MRWSCSRIVVTGQLLFNKVLMFIERMNEEKTLYC